MRFVHSILTTLICFWLLPQCAYPNSNCSYNSQGIDQNPANYSVISAESTSGNTYDPNTNSGMTYTASIAELVHNPTQDVFIAQSFSCEGYQPSNSFEILSGRDYFNASDYSFERASYGEPSNNVDYSPATPDSSISYDNNSGGYSFSSDKTSGDFDRPPPGDDNNGPYRRGGGGNNNDGPDKDGYHYAPPSTESGNYRGNQLDAATVDEIRRIFADERTLARLDKPFEARFVPQAPYRGWGFLRTQLPSNGYFPPLVTLYNECTTGQEFKNGVRALADKIRQNIRYLPDKTDQYGRYLEYDLTSASINEYSKLQKTIFDLEQELEDGRVPNDERPQRLGIPFDPISVPEKPYYGQGILLSGDDRHFPLFVEMYKQTPIYDEFKKRIYAEAERVRIEQANSGKPPHKHARRCFNCPEQTDPSAKILRLENLINQNELRKEREAFNEASEAADREAKQVQAAQHFVDRVKQYDKLDEEPDIYCEGRTFRDVEKNPVRAPGDERNIFKDQDIATLTSLPYILYRGYEGVSRYIEGTKYDSCPVLLDLYKQSKTFDKFLALVTSEADHIRKDSNYLRNTVKGHGLQREYWMLGGLVGSHEDYSIAQELILKTERQLLAAQEQKKRNEIARICEKIQAKNAQAFIDQVKAREDEEFGLDDDNEDDGNDNGNDQNTADTKTPATKPADTTTPDDSKKPGDHTPPNDHNRPDEPTGDNNQPESRRNATPPQNPQPPKNSASPQKVEPPTTQEFDNPPASFENSAYLKNLAAEYLERSATLTDDRYSRNFARYLQDRAASLLEAALNPTVRVKNNYIFDNALYEECPELVDVMEGGECTQAEARLYSEVHGSLATMRNLAAKDNNHFIQSNALVVMQISAGALLQDNPRAAFALAETTHHLANMVATMMPLLEKLGNLVANGTYKGAVMYTQSFVNFAQHPIDSLIDQVKAPFKLASAAFSTACIIIYGESEEREKLWDAAKAIRDHTIENPEDIIAMGMLFILPSPSSIATKGIGNIVSFAKKTGAAQKLGTVVSTAAGNINLGPAQKVIQSGAKAVGKAYGNLTDEVYATCKKLPFTKKSARHLHKGDLARKTNKPTGRHTERHCPGSVINGLSLPADKHGVYAAYYKRGNWAKLSTFFPKELSTNQIRRSLEQAYKNPIVKGPGEITGKTNSGMLIKICFARDAQGKVYVVTAYPLYKGLDDKNALIKALGQTDAVFKIIP